MMLILALAVELWHKETRAQRENDGSSSTGNKGKGKLVFSFTRNLLSLPFSSPCIYRQCLSLHWEKLSIHSDMRGLKIALYHYRLCNESILGALCNCCSKIEWIKTKNEKGHKSSAWTKNFLCCTLNTVTTAWLFQSLFLERHCVKRKK